LANIVESKPEELAINNETLQSRFNNWLMEEGLLVSKRDDPAADFHLIATQPNLSMNIDIIKLKNKPFIAIITGNLIPPEIKKSYSTIKEDERVRFTVGIQSELLKFGVEQRLDPNLIEPNLLELSDIVYIDDMTRTSFMNSVRRIKHAMLFFMWSFGQKFMPGKSALQSPSGYG